MAEKYFRDSKIRCMRNPQKINIKGEKLNSLHPIHIIWQMKQRKVETHLPKKESLIKNCKKSNFPLNTDYYRKFILIYAKHV